ncbi:MAG: contractile injection system protein, VgrG/Pvc8 family [Candidatus Promineifilaceae bacterium]
MLPGIYVLTNRIKIDGTFNPDVSQNIVAASVTETIDGLFACEIELLNHGVSGYFYLDRDEFDFGTEIEFGVGIGRTEEKLFQGYITGLEARYMDGGGSRLTILAEDGLQNLRMTRRTRTFEDVTDEDVMQTIAQEHSLQTDFEGLDGPNYRVLAQTNLSDLAFLRQCARRLNAELWLDDQTLHAAPRSSRGSDRVELAYGASLQSFQVRADLAHQCTEFSVGGWDVQAKEAIHETADSSAISSELNGFQSGSEILEDAFGERIASYVHKAPHTTAEARAIAEAEYQMRARRFVTGSGTADGDPRIRVGTILELSQLGTMFDGDYYITSTCHTIDLDTGYKTEFEVERAGVG